MTVKRKHGPRKRANKPAGWVKRKPQRKGINSFGLTKIEKGWGKIYIDNKKHGPIGGRDND